MRAMKDSGVEWIGEIPEPWRVTKVKHIATLNGRIGWQGLTANEYSDEGAYLITGVNFVNNKIDWDSCVHVPMSRWEEAPQIQIKDGDLLITKDGTVGKVALVTEPPAETSLNSGVLLIRTVADCQTRFLFWMLQSEIFWKWFSLINSGNSTIIHLYQYDFYGFSFPIPDGKAQLRIATFLDAKCAQIDAIIEKQQQVIEKLKAYKQSVITEAVTKGLDPTVPMKDSGVEWIGKVPENRSVIRLKYLIKHIESGVSVNAGQEEAKEGEYGVLKTSCVSKYEFDIHENKSVNYDEMDRVSCPVRGNTIIVSRMNTPELVGACGYVAEDSNVVFLPDRLWQVHFLEGLNVRFLWYFLISSNIRSYYESLSTGTSSSMQNISQGQFGNAFVALPEFEEQNLIVKHLDSHCAAIDSLTQKKKTVIDKLTDYKKSLIYEAVTGKMEV